MNTTEINKNKKIDDNTKKQILKLISDNSDINNFTDVSNIFLDLQASAIQTLLNAEIEHCVSNSNDNKKNGYSSKNKKIKTPIGSINVDMPRDRNSKFEPKIIKKRQRVIEDFSDIVTLLYAKGNTLNDIKDIIKNLYKIDLSPSYISNLISSINTELNLWHNRPLKPIYAFTMVDCLYCNVKIDCSSTKVAVYVMIGIDLKGKKEIIGIWISDGNESTSFWSEIFDDIKDRGVEDIIYMSMDGLPGLADAVELFFPMTTVQRCIVHLVRNMYSICNKKEVKEVIKYYKKIYTSTSEDECIEQYKIFKEKYKNNKTIIKKVDIHIQHILPLYSEPTKIRKMIYTTNAIESVNSSLRKVTKGKGMFINKQSLYKVLFLRIIDLEKKWSIGTRDWSKIIEELIIRHGDRITKHIY